jgi:hypothetical protein
MSEEFACPHCQKALRQVPEQAGTLVSCPYCQQQFTMPGANPFDSSSQPPDYETIESDMAAREPAPRPTGVTVFAVIGIILGGLGILCISCIGCSGMIASSVPEAQEGFQEGLEQSGLSLEVFIALMVVQFIISIILLVVSIGFLRGNETARKVFIGLACVTIVMSLGQLIYTGITSGDPAEMAQTICGSIIGLAYYIAGLIYFNQSSVKDWFAQQEYNAI